MHKLWPGLIFVWFFSRCVLPRKRALSECIIIIILRLSSEQKRSAYRIRRND